jgi:hypothetical protein
MPDTKIYKPGDTVTATLTLEPGHEIPTMVWVTSARAWRAAGIARRQSHRISNAPIGDALSSDPGAGHCGIRAGHPHCAGGCSQAYRRRRLQADRCPVLHARRQPAASPRTRP